ncbi:hypothetical protein [Allobranchiibius sp. GilTou38]|uniref:hypothetical protein n=1 Tax=Allobranchiibius sp. GilTou38 TaxID=2815210 RepID=UPI001AA1A3FA|nr:hypothetical protein [Allobranchiibius sp. GilTou38]MBO1767236.1 hypothetical protein [Allobranchiibius sp. GilTou38]
MPASTNLISRAAHDLSLATWFGGSLMGAVGLNGATAKAKDPSERLRLSTLGWARWTPVQIAAAAVHTVGGIGLIVGNRSRVARDPGSQANTIAKTVITLAAMGATGYSGYLGTKIGKHADEGGAGATEPSVSASTELASAQKQLAVVQWVIPALTGVLVVLGAQQGEQQRGLRGLLDI